MPLAPHLRAYLKVLLCLFWQWSLVWMSSQAAYVWWSSVWERTKGFCSSHENSWHANLSPLIGYQHCDPLWSSTKLASVVKILCQECNVLLGSQLSTRLNSKDFVGCSVEDSQLFLCSSMEHHCRLDLFRDRLLIAAALWIFAAPSLARLLVDYAWLLLAWLLVLVANSLTAGDSSKALYCHSTLLNTATIMLLDLIFLLGAAKKKKDLFTFTFTLLRSYFWPIQKSMAAIKMCTIVCHTPPQGLSGTCTWSFFYLLKLLLSSCMQVKNHYKLVLLMSF